MADHARPQEAGPGAGGAAVLTASGTSPRIGPNAVTQVFAALEAFDGSACVDRIIDAAGLAHYRRASPETMVPADEVRALHRAVRAALGPERGAGVLRAAGERTGQYLLVHRIPRGARVLLRSLRAPLASRLLVAAIRRHAWTFGVPRGLGIDRTGDLRLMITDNPLSVPGDAAAPCCDFYAATFETLFRDLVDGRLRVTETACRASNAPACVFVIRRRDADDSDVTPSSSGLSGHA